MLSRRHLLGAAALTGLLPLIASAQTASSSTRSSSAGTATTRRRQLVMIELQGGNDGLNTVIPIRHPRYGALRPTLGIAVKDALPLQVRDDVDGLAFHPALRPLMPAWERGALAVAMGVGQPGAPNRSHFRARDLWDLGVIGDDDRAGGWVGAATTSRTSPRRALVIAGDAGAFDDEHIAALAPSMPAILLDGVIDGVASSALAHVLRVAQDVDVGRRDVQRALGAVKGGRGHVAFAQQIEIAVRALRSDLDVVGLKLTLGGFDTHARQAPQQARLLGELATGLATLHAAIADRDDVVVIVQSEFGRRARENGSGGTDHGAANVAFVFGGGVAGGLIGAAPSLDDLDGQGDLRVGIDQRTLLAALAQRCFELDTAAATSCFKAAPLSL